MEFPQYRKYKNGKSFFKIMSMDKFIEIQLIGHQFLKYEMEAKILPDRNYIHDMLLDYTQNWDLITAEEFDKVNNKV